MRIYITGSVGSGKSTLAKRASQRTGWPCYCLDEVVYEEDPTDSWGNKRRPEAEIERRFSEALGQENYIMEDAGRAQFAEGMARADQIVLLELPGWRFGKTFDETTGYDEIIMEECEK